MCLFATGLKKGTCRSNKEKCELLSKFLYSSVRSLLSVDGPSIALGDQSRVLRGCLARERVSSLFRVNRLFEMICVTSLGSFRLNSPFGMIWSRRIRL